MQLFPHLQSSGKAAAKAWMLMGKGSFKLASTFTILKLCMRTLIGGSSSICETILAKRLAAFFASSSEAAPITITVPAAQKVAVVDGSRILMIKL